MTNLGEEKLCRCGCNELIISRNSKAEYINAGHSKRNKGYWLRKEQEKIIQLCGCGCGELASPGSKFIERHNIKLYCGDVRKGIPRSQEVKDAISKKNKGKKRTTEQLNRISEAHKGQIAWNKGRPRDQGTKEKISNSLIKYFEVSPQTKELKEKNKIGVAKAWAEGKMTPRSYNGKRFLYKNVWMRSTYEVECARQLDQSNVDWEYEPQRFWLEELQLTYLPDFYLPGFNIYLEVKGWMYPGSQEKIDAFRKLGYHLATVMEEDLWPK
jgi:hypothetical protein